MHYVFGAYSLDTQCHELHRAGVPVPLRRKVFEVLAYLVAQHARVVHKEELLEAVWPGQWVGDGGLNSCIMAVRTALRDRHPPQQFLHTVRGYGYRFVAPVEVRDQAPPIETLPIAPSRMAAASVPAPSPPPPPALPPAMARPTALAAPRSEGEYKPVSVLCGGLCDVPALAATLDPEALYRLMQTVVALAHEVSQSYGGTMTHQAPEGFTVVFGAPVAQEDHARRAVLAALDLQQRLRQHPILPTPALGAGLAVSMGVHSGLAVVGEVGPTAHRQVTAVGAPIQGAMQLQQHAAAGTLLVSSATYHLVHEEVRGEACRSLTLDGLQAPLPVYAVQGLVQRRAGVPWRAPRFRSPFVGRQRELALLHDRLEAVQAGASEVVSLVGPPGIGKTRLLTEFGHRVAGQVPWVFGQCLAYGQTTPYLPVRDIVQHVCGIVAGDAIETRMAAVRRQLAALGSVAEEDMALVLQLLDLPVAPALLAPISLEARQARTFALLGHLIRHEAHRQPLVLAVENVHWIDPSSEAWLGFLVERLAGTAVLLLVTQRPGYQPPWGTHAAVTQLALPPLRAEDSQAVMAAVPGTAQLPVAQRQQIVVHGAGNPFFVEELAWYAVEYGLSATPVPVPETVHAVLAARLDRLPAEAKAILQTAAVIGHEVPLPLLQAIAELSEAELQQSLAHLQATELLYETRLFPEWAFTFKHALTQEVAYGSLLQERRRVLHARIVEALAALVGDRVPEQVDRLAHHAMRGEVWDKALAYCRQAGEKALARSAHREAVGYFEQALSALPHLPETRDIREQAIDLRLALRWALLPSCDFERILAYLREAESLAVALADPHWLAQISLFLSYHFYIMGAHDQAIATAQRALDLATAGGDGVLHAQANLYLGIAYQARGSYRRAIDCFRQTAAAFDGTWPHERFGLPPAVVSRYWLTRSYAELGMFAEGSAAGAEGLRIAEAMEHHVSLMLASWGIGLLAFRHGDLPRASALLERAMGICRDTDLPAYFPKVAGALGAAYTLGGRVADAVSLLTQAMEQMIATDIVGWQAFCSLPLGEAQMLAGRLEEAHALAERTLALACQHQERGHQAYALHLLGDIATRREPLERALAEAHYQQALALADELGMRPLQAHCHLGLGTLYAQVGQRESARAALSTALALYQAMAMTFWLPQAAAVLAQVEAGG